MVYVKNIMYCNVQALFGHACVHDTCKCFTSCIVLQCEFNNIHVQYIQLN
jgi:hypothetical protein